MKRILLILALTAAVACQDKSGQETVSALADPSGLKVEQTDPATVNLTWTDNADGEKGYRIFLRGKDDSANVQPLATLDADAVSFTFGNLVAGEVYDFGVQAVSEDYNLHSRTVYVEDYKVLTLEELWDQGSVKRVAAPSELSIVQEDNAMNAVFSWKDNASDEKGYKVYVRKASAASFGKASATLGADVTTYTFSNLAGGTPYVFGVQATGATEMNDSQIQTVELTLEDYSKIPVVTEVKTSYAYVAVSYKIQKLNGANPEHGVCFSASSEPTVNVCISAYYRQSFQRKA